MRNDLLSQHALESLKKGILRHEPIRYRESGHRRVSAASFLPRAREAARRAGITRLADISHLSPAGFPVFQSARPSVLHHWTVGQNTGAQGKGLDRRQAELSCLMESIEAYCAEPRNPQLIRASYDFLRRAQPAADPRIFLPNTRKLAPKIREPLLWTESLCLRSRARVLIPAETVYFPFDALEFGTRALFNCSTNGLASGTSYLEAALHGLYEVIERHYASSEEVEFDLLDQRKGLPAQLRSTLGRSRRALDAGAALDVYWLREREKSNLPFFCAVLQDAHGPLLGYGCHSSPDIAVTRAVSEVFQSLATRLSGSREDVVFHDEASTRGLRSHWNEIRPARPTAALADVHRACAVPRFRDLRNELDFLLGWLRNRGFGSAYAVNLSRRGIDLPVVKVVVPGLRVPPGLWFHGLVAGRPSTLRQRQFSFRVARA